MALVGDIILRAREAVPDAPQVLPAPLSSNITYAAVSSVNPLPSGQIFLQSTFTNPWGETLAGPEFSLTLDGTQAVQVSGFLGWATSVKVYAGFNGAGSEQWSVQSSTLPFTITGGSNLLPNGSSPQSPPSHSSAWLPDTDGMFAPASMAYGWLNEGLLEASKTSGGIPDMTGAPSSSNGNIYTIPGNWIRFSDAWYDGYEIFLGTRSDNWYQAQISSLAWNAIVSQWANFARIELFPQNQRTSGQGSVSSPVAASDQIVNVSFNPSLPFGVPVGLALLGTVGGNPGAYEIVSYTGFSSTQLTGVARGFGGTQAAAWPEGTEVNELNIRLSGYRYASSYQPGSASQTIDIPAEWVSPLIDFVAAQFKKAEHEYAQAKQLTDGFYAVMRAYGAKNNVRTGPKQRGGNPGTLIYFPSPFHGVIVP